MVFVTPLLMMRREKEKKREREGIAGGRFCIPEGIFGSGAALVPFAVRGGLADTIEPKPNLSRERLHSLARCGKARLRWRSHFTSTVLFALLAVNDEGETATNPHTEHVLGKKLISRPSLIPSRNIPL